MWCRRCEYDLRWAARIIIVTGGFNSFQAYTSNLIIIWQDERANQRNILTSESGQRLKF